MSDIVRQFIEFLQRDISEWEEAAQFYEKLVNSVHDLGEAEARPGKEEAAKYRARISERRRLIEDLRAKQ